MRLLFKNRNVSAGTWLLICGRHESGRTVNKGAQNAACLPRACLCRCQGWVGWPAAHIQELGTGCRKEGVLVNVPLFIAL